MDDERQIDAILLELRLKREAKHRITRHDRKMLQTLGIAPFNEVSDEACVFCSLTTSKPIQGGGECDGED